MTNEPAPLPNPSSEPASDRARIDAARGARRLDWLPILYLVGLVVLAGAVLYLWENQPGAQGTSQQADQVRSLQAQIASLQADITKLQQRPAASPSDVDAVRQQVAQVASRPAAAPPADLQPLQERIAALEARPAAGPDQSAGLQQQIKTLTDQVADLQRVAGRVDALEKRPAFDPAAVDSRLGTLAQRVEQGEQQAGSRLQEMQAKLNDAIQSLQAKLGAQQAATDSRVEELDRQQKAIAARAMMAARLQGVAAALATGQKLGPIPGAPPALARFADQPAPTESTLRASFERYAAAAQQANLPVVSQNQDFLGRLWTRAQRSVTVREGDHVLVGDPLAGVLAQARAQLDTGNLEGAVAALKGLSGPAAQAMQPWVEQAQSLLDARSAIATLAAG